jgi:CheY-like chemotaxis protein
MDVQMPEIDGLEASRRINALYGNSRPRLVAVTANAMREDRARCIEAGMDDYVYKPVSSTALREILVLCGKYWQRARDNAAGEDLPKSTDGLGDLQADRHSICLDGVTSQAQTSAVTHMEDDVIAPTHLEELRSMQDILPELFETFRSEVSGNIRLLREAVKDGRCEAIAIEAHTIVGAAGSVGGQWLAAICRELERKGRAGSLEGAAVLLRAVDSEYDALCDALAHVVVDT